MDTFARHLRNNASANGRRAAEGPEDKPEFGATEVGILVIRPTTDMWDLEMAVTFNNTTSCTKHTGLRLPAVLIQVKIGA